MFPALTSSAISVHNVKNGAVLMYAAIWLCSKQQNSIWSSKYRMSGVTTQLLKFNKFSAKGKHLSSNFYKKIVEAIKFRRSIFPLVLFSTLLTPLSSCFYQVFQPYLSTKPWEGVRIHWNITNLFFILFLFFLSFLLPHFSCRIGID